LTNADAALSSATAIPAPITGIVSPTYTMRENSGLTRPRSPSAASLSAVAGVNSTDDRAGRPAQARVHIGVAPGEQQRRDHADRMVANTSVVTTDPNR
jgi:hypothetical protein